MPDKSKSSPSDARLSRPARLRAGRRRPDRLQPAGARARPRGHRAAARQPPRARHRGHRHRQDRDAAGAGRGLLRRRSAGVRRRHQGRPVGPGRERRAPSRTWSARRGDRSRRATAMRLPGGLLGRAGRAGPSRARHRAGDGAAAAVPPARADRAAGGRAQHRLQWAEDERKAGDAKHGDRRPAGPARRHRRDGQARVRRCAASTATSRRRPSA